MNKPILFPQENRIKQDIENIGNIGKVGETGVSRLTWSSEDFEARKYVIELMQQADLVVSEDTVGNIVGKRNKCSDPSASVVMTGSHLDTPDIGGRYDGVAGVIAGIETVRTLNDKKIETKHPIEVVVFAGEELARFGASFKGSLGMAGLLTPELMRGWKDKNGVTYWEALSNAGYKPEKYEESIRLPESIKAFIELHIEQGPVLESERKSIGIVSSITGASRRWATIKGKEDHSGATPMRMRQDALCAAAELILALERFSFKEGHKGTVGTVGALWVEPCTANVVPGKVRMSVEHRSINGPSKRKVMEQFSKFVDLAQDTRNVEINLEDFLEDEDPYHLSEYLIEKFKNQCEKLDIDYLVMPSGAGHDAQQITRLIDNVGMIFVPSKNGYSHCPEEFTDIEDLVKGTKILANTMYEIAMSS